MYFKPVTVCLGAHLALVTVLEKKVRVFEEFSPRKHSLSGELPVLREAERRVEDLSMLNG